MPHPRGPQPPVGSVGVRPDATTFLEAVTLMGAMELLLD